MKANTLLQITSQQAESLGKREKTGISLAGTGILLLLVATFGSGSTHPLLFLLLSLGTLSAGALVYFSVFLKRPAGINNHNLLFQKITNRGAIGWLLGVVLTGFYVLIYWFPQTLGHLIAMTDPLSRALRAQPSDQWFLYGTFYTLAILIMGIRALYRYRHSRYQVIRTFSVMFFQLGFAFLIPAFLLHLNNPEFYFSYFWPLKPEYLFPSTIKNLTESAGALGTFMVGWGAIMTFVATPVLTFFFGKRWYCSWVCGCGGLAETAGDPFRHLSDKSMKAWRIERWMIHSVLVLILVTTLLLWLNSYYSGAILGELSGGFSKGYGFFIGAIFSGVIGVGFYPIMGSRVWCRFGCPLAAILGLFQRFFSRFRITTNGGQCISCGNCSKYCEMGIDVQAYAQRGQSIVRSSCVGCEMCEAVCPRGVLHLENGPVNHDRPAIRISKNGITVVE